MSNPIHLDVQKTFEAKGLQAVFREVLGWDASANEFESFPTSLATVRGEKIASLLNGVVVFRFDFSGQPAVVPSLQKEISRAVGARYVERLLVFETDDSTTWLWPKKTASGALTHEKLIVPSKTLPLYLAQRLSALRFSSADHMRGVSIQELREKLRGSFDTSTVTKKFFDRFKRQHEDLASSIKGLTPEEAGSYATLLLNRLMFIYFLQKKEFLNSDSNYLRTCLRQIQSLEQPASFYGFYRDLLLVLFFEGLNKKERDFSAPQIQKIIGQVPYVNGGIFGETELERNKRIDVPDKVFESIFDFFDSFTWHLDTRPTGKADEINPEVIGYIFEQYINFTAGGKKENGAYYTKQDVTGYMVSQTLVPRILDLLFENGLDPLALVHASKDRYIFDSMLHGWNADEGEWHTAPSNLHKLWLDDPKGWGDLDDAKQNTDLCLPGESWVEMFHRRERVGQLRRQISNGEISEVNELITLNLNGQLLLLDALQTLDSEADLKQIWERLSTLSIIDPTCGSGAFLFAALEVLEDVYSALIDVAEELSIKSEFAQMLIREIALHPNRRYFIRKKASLSNLFGTDLMPDAIETAKLRVFLALASCLDSTSEMEPLPDLDFNFKAGNLIVGIQGLQDVDRISEGDLTSQLELRQLEPLISDYSNKYGEFVRELIGNEGDTAPAKASLSLLNKSIRFECDQVLARLLFIPPDEVKSWISEKRPFHWFAEFPQVFARGGFDVVVGNPPYVKRSECDVNDFRGYLTHESPDLFAVCYERSLSLLSTSGRHSFVVMLNLAFSPSFGPLRKVIASREGSEWWSTYGKRPDSLFAGVQVVNTILTVAVGTTKMSTAHRIFSKESRLSLFETLDFYPITRSGKDIPLRGGMANLIAERIRDAKLLSPVRQSEATISVRLTGRYWFPGLPTAPLLLDDKMQPTHTTDPRVPSVQLYEGEDKSIALASLVGKLGYLWWSSTGDDFHTKTSETIQPRVLALSVPSTSALKSSAEAVLESGMTAAFASRNAGWLQSNIRWTSVRDKTDVFDKELLDSLGLGEEWRNLNIWYRQVMKSTGENSNGVVIPEGLARQIFGV